VRITPRDVQVHRRDIAIRAGALEGLMLIDAALETVSAGR
jgi:hypothetical protein